MSVFDVATMLHHVFSN